MKDGPTTPARASPAAAAWSSCSTTTASCSSPRTPRRALHKISEIYDRIAFAAVGKYNEFENLRMAGVRLRRPARLLLRPPRRHRPRPGQRLRADPRHDLHRRAPSRTRSRSSWPRSATTPAERPDLPAHLRRLGRRRARLRRDGRVRRGRSLTRSRSAAPEGADLESSLSRLAVDGCSARHGAAGRHGDAARSTAGQLEVAVLDRTRPRAVRSAGSAGRPSRTCSGWTTTAPRRPASCSSGSRPRHGLRQLRAGRLGGGMDRRIFGLENEYGVTCTFRGQRRLSPDEVARYLFRRVVSWGRSSNVFLRNGARLYLDVGSHPEYATPECDDIRRARHPRQGGGADPRGPARRRRAAAARGGHRRRRLPVQEQHRLGRQLLRLPRELPRRPARRVLPAGRRPHPVPRHPADHLRRRQGAADPARRRLLRQPAGRAHLGGRLSSATTRSRPIINTRDEPHADAERYRRLHVIVGDSNMTRDDDAAQGRRDRPGAAHDRGRRRACAT